MTPLLRRIRWALQRSGCAAPVTAAGGVLRCVSTAGPHGVCDDHLAWRSFEIPLRILFALRPWWPNDLGREMDSEGRERRSRGLPFVADGRVHAKLLDDTRCCPAAEAGAFSTTFHRIVDCEACLRRLLELAPDIGVAT